MSQKNWNCLLLELPIMDPSYWISFESIWNIPVCLVLVFPDIALQVFYTVGHKTEANLRLSVTLSKINGF